MKLVYMCFVSNGFDDHFIKLVCSATSGKEFLPGIVREYWKASTGITDAAGPYVVALDLETLRAKPIGMFQLYRDGKIYAQVGRGEFSGKPETPESFDETVLQRMGDL